MTNSQPESKSKIYLDDVLWQWPREDILHAITIMIESSTQPATSAAIQQAEERLQILLPGIYRGRTDEVRPVSMGSAPLAFDIDGNVEWDRMWGSFCDLAMAGGPPHKGKLLEPGTQESIIAEPEKYARICDEIVRGISLAARLQAAPGPTLQMRVKASIDYPPRYRRIPFDAGAPNQSLTRVSVACQAIAGRIAVQGLLLVPPKFRPRVFI